MRVLRISLGLLGVLILVPLVRTMPVAATSCGTSGAVISEGMQGDVTTRVTDGVKTQFLTGNTALAYMEEQYGKNRLRAAAHAKG